MDATKHEMLQQEVQALASLVDETTDELVGVVSQWRGMVDLLSARLMAWQVQHEVACAPACTQHLPNVQASTNTRLAGLLTRVREVEMDIDSFASDLNADAATMQSMYDDLAEERAAFAAHMQAAREEFAATQALATSLNENAAGRVKLNVGGTRFEIAVDTLCKVEQPPECQVLIFSTVAHRSAARSLPACWRGGSSWWLTLTGTPFSTVTAPPTPTYSTGSVTALARRCCLWTT